MNENPNLIEILKDCPRGTKLYSTIFGIVEFEKIRTDNNYPIVFNYKDKDGNHFWGITVDGRHSIKHDGECTLFPSKDQRDWSKFNIKPKFNISTLQPFDKVLVRDCVAYKWRCDFFESYIKGADLPFHTLNGWYKQCIPYNNETKRLVDTNRMPLEKYINWEE